MSIKIIFFDFFDVLYNLEQNDELLDIIDQIKKKGIKVGLISNSNREYMFTMFNSIVNKFHYTIFSSDINYSKPEKEIFKYALEVSGFKADESIFVDDNEDNIDGAKKFGMNVHLFESNEKIKYYFKILELI